MRGVRVRALWKVPFARGSENEPLQPSGAERARGWGRRSSRDLRQDVAIPVRRADRRGSLGGGSGVGSFDRSRDRSCDRLDDRSCGRVHGEDRARQAAPALLTTVRRPGAGVVRCASLAGHAAHACHADDVGGVHHVAHGCHPAEVCRAGPACRAVIASRAACPRRSMGASPERTPRAPCAVPALPSASAALGSRDRAPVRAFAPAECRQRPPACEA